LIAKAIHESSPRATKPLSPSTVPTFRPELLESELFGHTRGAFTGAVAAKKGLFEVADGGSIFLDEIGDIPPETQVRLLRVIQEREFTPLGDTSPRRVDVRIVAATNIDLREAVRQGMFREDLYYRLSVVPIELPPLRDRRQDVLPLAQHFIRKYNAENSPSGLRAHRARSFVSAGKLLLARQRARVGKRDRTRRGHRPRRRNIARMPASGNS
jgi:transcriptional regulator with GAF, ATPase, and Fis domain